MRTDVVALSAAVGVWASYAAVYDSPLWQPGRRCVGSRRAFCRQDLQSGYAELDNPSLADIQALCLLTIHEWGNRNAVRAYVYLGQAARMTQMYRIITSHQSRDPDQFIKDESFRRTLWLIYILDCFLTSSPGRNPAVSHRDVKDVPLPCPDMSYNFGTPAFVRTMEGNPPAWPPPKARLWPK
ncbi:hypothetical protein NUW58_g3433 [Xylaria curta]|uniref:Uncharacterized protein n=1 Tax=Xylaria curta TaxID=42375 RepID=A0ACC1PE46_9PEZI|nr:hypothetical protein NUW58_g3433 [Xylaria curta]